MFPTSLEGLTARFFARSKPSRVPWRPSREGGGEIAPRAVLFCSNNLRPFSILLLEMQFVKRRHCNRDPQDKLWERAFQASMRAQTIFVPLG
jgi:hypothetical protein